MASGGEYDVSITNIIIAVVLLLCSISVTMNIKKLRIIPMGMVIGPVLSLASGVISGFLLYNEFNDL